MERLITDRMYITELTNDDIATICFKLYKYEDAELTPEEIISLQADRDYWEREAKKWCVKLGEIRMFVDKPN